jgi:hypothetical protein
MLLLAFAIFANVEHCQAAKCATADIEGHSEAAKFSQSGRLSGGVMSALPQDRNLFVRSGVGTRVCARVSHVGRGPIARLGGAAIRFSA